MNKSLLGKKLHLMGFNFSDLNKSIVSAVICVSEAARSGGRKSPEMRHAADAAKRRRFSTSWPTNCLYHTALAPTWTKPPSWGWPSASCAHASCSPHVRTHSYYGENWSQRSWGKKERVLIVACPPRQHLWHVFTFLSVCSALSCSVGRCGWTNGLSSLLVLDKIRNGGSGAADLLFLPCDQRAINLNCYNISALCCDSSKVNTFFFCHQPKTV